MVRRTPAGVEAQLPDVEVLADVPAAPAELSNRYLWVGVDGSTWDLTDGPVSVMAGIRGLGLPTPEHWLDDGLSDGTTHQGLRIPSREVFLPVRVRGGEDIADLDAAFAASLDPAGQGTLIVQAPNTRWRAIDLRYQDGAEGEYDLDLRIAQRATYGLRMVAEDPYWYTDPVTVDYSAESPASFYGAGAPPFNISASQALADATVTNHGDVPAPAVWTITAPFTSFTVGVGPAMLSMALAKATGWIRADMRPGVGRIVDEAGANRFAAVTDARFAPIPPGREVRLGIALAGPGAGSSVQLAFTPRYRRAW